MESKLKKTQGYRAPWYLFNGHAQTIYPFWKDEAETPPYDTETLELSDGDFLELDWLTNGSKKLLIICHGLEGNSRSHYVKQSANYFFNKGWDVLAWNFRSCGKQPNRKPFFYHAGDTRDLDAVVNSCSDCYDELVVCGFSIGGSLAFNYGSTSKIPENIKAIIGFSVPLDFHETLTLLDQPSNRIYQRKFLDKLNRKALSKADQLSQLPLKLDQLSIKSLTEFTEKVTAPIHGYDNVNDFCEVNNCLNALRQSSLPTLLVNALNDPFLGSNSFPKEMSNPNVHVEYTHHGGHTGYSLNGKPYSWMELRMQSFLDDLMVSKTKIIDEPLSNIR